MPDAWHGTPPLTTGVQRSGQVSHYVEVKYRGLGPYVFHMAVKMAVKYAKPPSLQSDLQVSAQSFGELTQVQIGVGEGILSGNSR